MNKIRFSFNIFYCFFVSFLLYVMISKLFIVILDLNVVVNVFYIIMKLKSIYIY